MCVIYDPFHAMSDPHLVVRHMQLTGEDSYQIAIMGVQGLRVEIVSDAPPPPDEPPYVPSLPPCIVADVGLVHLRKCLVPHTHTA